MLEYLGTKFAPATNEDLPNNRVPHRIESDSLSGPSFLAPYEATILARFVALLSVPASSTDNLFDAHALTEVA
jgi:hypothetical protein